MRKYIVLLGVLLLGFSAMAIYCQDSPLKAEIKLVRTAVRNKENFSVSTIIRNASANEQAFAVLYCCYAMLWTADNPSVQTDCSEACARNSAVKITLKPGETYEKNVLVRVELPAGTSQTESVTFRLGFHAPIYRSEPKIPTIWSNAITVKVTNDGDSRGAAKAKTNLPADSGSGTGGITITHVCETTNYNPKPPGAPPTSITLLEGGKVTTASSVLVYNTSNHTYNGILTIKNDSKGTILGPFQVVLDSLTDGVTLANSTSTFSCWPYLTVPAVDSLEPGQSATVNVQFSNPKNATIKYVPMVYSGSFD
jgi:hypothetical protein